MNEIQRIAVAAGFIVALEHSDEKRTEWKEIASSRKWDDLHALIQKTLGLAEKPTAADVAWMHSFADRHLLWVLEELHKIDAGINPQCVLNGRDGMGEGC